MSTVVKIQRGNIRTSLPVANHGEALRRIAMIEAEHESKAYNAVYSGMSPENVIERIDSMNIPYRPVTKILNIPVSR